MKYILILFLSLSLLTNCDDGDLITETFNFETNTNVIKCDASNILYKINGTEALILNTPEENFPNVETVVNLPRVVVIGNTTNILYRKYSETVAANSICSSPAPATPIVLEEWNIIGGTMQIITTKLFDTNGTTVVAYNHNIVLKNVTFVTAGKQVVYDTYAFGNYRTNVIKLPFEFTSSQTIKCTNNSLIFRYNANEVLLLDLDQSIFVNSATVAGSPRTQLINATNKVVYRTYNGSLNANFFCSSIPPTSPLLVDEWIGQEGVLGVSGIIKVDTEALTNPTAYKHTITLFKVTFKKGFQTYTPLTNDYVFGTYITTP